MAASHSSLRQFNRPCAVCNGGVGILLYRQVFSRLSDNGSLLSGYDVVTCSNCGFCFADNIPEQVKFDSYYRDMSKYEKVGRSVEETPYDQARFQRMADVILGLLGSKHTRVFEVGCANGQLLALLKKHGYENVSGIDPSHVSAKIARERYGIRVSANTLSGLPLDGKKVDFLILAGVLEHVRDFDTALLHLRQILSDKGSIFITVPDASRYPDGEDAPFQEFSVEHINFFGPDSLVNLLSVNGFTKTFIQQDMIESNYRTTTPVVHGLFKKTEDPLLRPFQRDNQTQSGLEKYIEISVQAERNIQVRIDKIVDTGKSIVVWGTGAHTLHLLATGKLGTAKIKAFIDSNPRYQGKSLSGVPIISPQDLNELPYPILISSRVYQDEIAAQIQDELKLDNEIIKLY